MIDYRPLNTARNEIRLLSILPPPNNSSVATKLSQEPICCRLEHVSLDDFCYEYKSYQSNLPPDTTRDEERKAWENKFKPTRALHSHPRGPGGLFKTFVGGFLSDSDEDDEDESPQVEPPPRFNWGDFNALSYTWGDEHPTCNITINDQVVEVRENLAMALRVFREAQDKRLKEKIWVDAVCINQQDIKERNAQIKRMKDIYSLARNVVVWLGNEADQSSELVDFMVGIHLQCVEDQSKVSRALTENGDVDIYLKALKRFLSRPYWHRLWIIQELAMGREDTPIVCGQRIVPWMMVTNVAKLILENCALRWLLISREEIPRGGIPSLDLQHIGILQKLHQVPQRQEAIDVDRLETLLRLAQTSDAKDKKDKVYGIMGLLDRQISERIDPEYADSKSLLSVYIDLIKALIESTGDLSFIFRFGQPDLDANWPTWVPDLRAGLKRNVGSDILGKCASGESSANIRIIPTGPYLCCQGFLVDFIEEKCCPTPTRSRNPRKVFPNSCEYGNRYALALSLWKTLCLGIGCDGLEDLEETPLSIPWFDGSDLEHAVPDEWARQGWSTVYQTLGLYPHILTFRSKFKDFKIRGTFLRDFFPQKIGRCKYSRDIEQQLHFFAMTNSGRNLVGTSNGFLGLAPANARQGDYVYILLGCNVPVILRLTGGGSFKVIGECYIQGLMDGEAMNCLGHGGYSVGEVMLC
jgi:hypothetical protein